MSDHNYVRPLVPRTVGFFDYKVEEIVAELRKTGRTIFDLEAIYKAVASLYPEHQSEDNMMFIVEEVAADVQEALREAGCQTT